MNFFSSIKKASQVRMMIARPEVLKFLDRPKMRFSILALFAFWGFLMGGGCYAPESSTVEFHLNSQKAVLLDTAMTSCKSYYEGGSSGDLASISTQLRNLSLNWKGKKDLSLIFMEVKLTGGGLSAPYSSVLSGEELQYLWTGVKNEVVLHTDDTITNKCALRLGGIDLKDKTKPTSGQGVINLYGVTTDDDGNDVDVQAQVVFQFDFSGEF